MMIESQLKENLGFLLESELLEEISKVGSFKQKTQGELLIDIGQEMLYMPLVLKGSVKVMREDKEGNELLLYFIEAGDTCAMTLNCCMGNKKSEIKAFVEQDVDLIFVPVQKMDEWLAKYKSWRSYILESYHIRFHEMIEAIDSLAFYNMKERLLKYLSDKVKVLGTTSLSNTHLEIATELNSSRVVISRLLKQLEQDKKIVIKRNKLEVLEF